MEVVLPTSHFGSLWQTAFRYALPSSEHRWRIRAQDDAIIVIFDNERQHTEYLQVAINAIGAANRELEELDVMLDGLTRNLEIEATDRRSRWPR